MREPDPLFLRHSQLQEGIWSLIQVQRHMESYRDERIGPAMWRLLLAIAYRQHRQAPINQQKLAQDLRVSKQALWRVGRALRDKNLITITRDVKDGRARNMALTRAGHDAVNDLIDAQGTWLGLAWRKAGVAAVDGFRTVLGILNPEPPVTNPSRTPSDV